MATVADIHAQSPLRLRAMITPRPGHLDLVDMPDLKLNPAERITVLSAQRDLQCISADVFGRSYIISWLNLWIVAAFTAECEGPLFDVIREAIAERKAVGATTSNSTSGLPKALLPENQASLEMDITWGFTGVINGIAHRFWG